MKKINMKRRENRITNLFDNNKNLRTQIELLNAFPPEAVDEFVEDIFKVVNQTMEKHELSILETDCGVSACAAGKNVEHIYTDIENSIKDFKLSRKELLPDALKAQTVVSVNKLDNLILVSRKR